MSYMVAKYIWSPGSIALEHKPGNNISDAKYAEKLAHIYLGSGIEILTVGNFEVHAEYKPVTYVESRKEFEREIEKMCLKETGTLKNATVNDFDELVRRVADKNDATFKELIKHEKKDEDIQ